MAGLTPAEVRIPETDEFHIVVAHAPDFALGYAPADLLVAGHTHGGQVQAPFIGPLLTLSRVPRNWAAGGLIGLDGDRHLVVSRGIGMERGWAPRLRFLCPPQLVVIDLKPA
jgi:predicted MPP superfamily phosphohydrolase